ncbi:MAG: hypothetical protein FWG32_06655 [Oscillospiraceae bacterium]|nr:hypothetical protein [Oscillospiraceae bacterium]
MKKALAFVLILVMALGTSVTAFAAPPTEGSIDLTYVHTIPKNDPSFTVTIPSAVELSAEGTEAAFVVQDVENLDGKKISVTLAGTSQDNNHLAVKHTSYLQFAYYSITLPTGETVVNDNPRLMGGTAFAGDEPVSYIGKELLSYTDFGRQVLTFTAIPRASLYEGDTYRGSITFGISVVD